MEAPIEDGARSESSEALSGASWPSLAQGGRLDAFCAEMYLRRENKRLGWRRCAGTIVREPQIDAEQFAVHIHAMGPTQERLHDIPVDRLRVDEAKRNVRSLAAQAPGGRPVYRLLLHARGAAPVEVGFLGGEAGAKQKRDVWLGELVLAGATCSLALACEALAPYLRREPASDVRRVVALTALLRALETAGSNAAPRDDATRDSASTIDDGANEPASPLPQDRERAALKCALRGVVEALDGGTPAEVQMLAARCVKAAARLRGRAAVGGGAAACAALLVALTAPRADRRAPGATPPPSPGGARGGHVVFVRDAVGALRQLLADDPSAAGVLAAPAAATRAGAVSALLAAPPAGGDAKRAGITKQARFDAAAVLARALEYRAAARAAAAGRAPARGAPCDGDYPRFASAARRALVELFYRAESAADVDDAARLALALARESRRHVRSELASHASAPLSRAVVSALARARDWAESPDARPKEAVDARRRLLRLVALAADDSEDVAADDADDAYAIIDANADDLSNYAALRRAAIKCDDGDISAAAAGLPELAAPPGGDADVAFDRLLSAVDADGSAARGAATALVYAVTFDGGGQHGLGLELTAGASRGGAVAPAVHRANSATSRRGVRPGDELLEVNGRRVDSAVEPRAAHAAVRQAMLAACDVVRDAPWPKRLVFCRLTKDAQATPGPEQGADEEQCASGAPPSDDASDEHKSDEHKSSTPKVRASRRAAGEPQRAPSSWQQPSSRAPSSDDLVGAGFTQRPLTEASLGSAAAARCALACAGVGALLVEALEAADGATRRDAALALAPFVDGALLPRRLAGRALAAAARDVERAALLFDAKVSSLAAAPRDEAQAEDAALPALRCYAALLAATAPRRARGGDGDSDGDSSSGDEDCADEWWAAGGASTRHDFRFDAAPLGCVIVLHAAVTDGGVVLARPCCRVEAIDGGGAAAQLGLLEGDVLLDADGREPPVYAEGTDDVLGEYVKSLAFPLVLRVARRSTRRRAADGQGDGAVTGHADGGAHSSDGESDGEGAADELRRAHDAALSLCASTLLYSSRRSVAHAAIRCVDGAARRGGYVARLAHARAMDVRTATAVALTPGVAESMATWSPDETGGPSLSRDEAAAMIPLAEATVAEAVPLAEGLPRILNEARVRTEGLPDYVLQPEAAASMASSRSLGRAASSSGDGPELPGSAIARLLEVASLGSRADDGGDRKDASVNKAAAPPTRRAADAAAADARRESALRVAALEALGSLCGAAGSRRDEADDGADGPSLARLWRQAAAACVAEPRATRVVVGLLGGSHGGGAARAAVRFVRAVARAKRGTAKALVDAGCLAPLAWLLRCAPSATEAPPRAAALARLMNDAARGARRRAAAPPRGALRRRLFGAFLASGGGEKLTAAAKKLAAAAVAAGGEHEAELWLLRDSSVDGAACKACALDALELLTGAFEAGDSVAELRDALDTAASVALGGLDKPRRATRAQAWRAARALQTAAAGGASWKALKTKGLDALARVVAGSATTWLAPPAARALYDVSRRGAAGADALAAAGAAAALVAFIAKRRPADGEALTECGEAPADAPAECAPGAPWKLDEVAAEALLRLALNSAEPRAELAAVDASVVAQAAQRLLALAPHAAASAFLRAVVVTCMTAGPADGDGAAAALLAVTVVRAAPERLGALLTDHGDGDAAAVLRFAADHEGVQGVWPCVRGTPRGLRSLWLVVGQAATPRGRDAAAKRLGDCVAIDDCGAAATARDALLGAPGAGEGGAPHADHGVAARALRALLEGGSAACVGALSALVSAGAVDARGEALRACVARALASRDPQRREAAAALCALDAPARALAHLAAKAAAGGDAGADGPSASLEAAAAAVAAGMVGEGVHAAAAAVLRCAVERDAGARAALKDDAAGLLAALEGLLDAAAAPVRECALRTLAALAGGDDFRVDVAASGKVRGRVIDILDEFSAAAALAEARKAVAEGDGTEDDSVKHDALEDDTVEDGSVQRNALEDKDDAVDDAVPRDALEEEEYGAGEGSEEGSASRSTLGEDDSEDDSSASRSEIGEDDAVDDDSVARSALGEEGAVEKGSASRSAVGEGDSEEGGSMDNDSVARSAVGESDAFEDGSVARSALGEEGAVEDSSAVVEEGAVEDGYALIEEDTVDEGSALVEEDAVDEGSALIEQGAAAEGVLGASSLLVGTDAEFEAAARIAFAMASSAEADVGALLQLAECVGRAVECGGAPPGSLRWLADAVSALAARRPAADALASRAPLRHALLAASTARAAPPEIETAWPRHAGRADAVEGTAFAAAFAFAALVRHLPLAAHAVDVVAALAPDDDAWPRRPASQEEHERAAVACLLFGALRGAALAATDAERAGVRESLARGGADVVAAAARARTPARFSARAFLAALAPRTALELDDGDAQTPAAETRVPPCSEDDCEKARAAEDFLERQRIALGMSGVDDEGTARDEGRSADEAIARRGGPEAPPAGAAEARVEPELEPWQRSRTPALEDDDDDEDEASQAASSADGAARRERALNRAGSVAESRAVRRPGCGYDDDDDDDDPELQAALALSARSLVEDEARREAADALADGDDTPSLVRAVSEGTLPAAPPAAADASAAVQSDDREADKHDEAAVARSGSAPRPSDREEEGSPPEAAADDDDEDQKRDDDEHPVLETRDEAGPASPRGDDDDGTDSDDGASSASSASSTQAAPAPPAYAAASDERAPGGPPPARGPPAYEPAKPDSENDSDDDGASDLLAALELSRQATEVEGGGAESSAAVEARGRADAEARGCADARPAERRRPASPGAPPPPPAYDQVCSPKSPAPPPPAAPPTPGGRRAAEPVSPTASPTTRPDAKAKKQKGIRLF